MIGPSAAYYDPAMNNQQGIDLEYQFYNNMHQQHQHQQHYSAANSQQQHQQHSTQPQPLSSYDVPCQSFFHPLLSESQAGHTDALDPLLQI